MHSGLQKEIQGVFIVELIPKVFMQRGYKVDSHRNISDNMITVNIVELGEACVFLFLPQTVKDGNRYLIGISKIQNKILTTFVTILYAGTWFP